MGVAQWARLTLDRLGSKMRSKKQPDEDDLLLEEEDPIGEFLSRRERGDGLAVGEEALEEEEMAPEPAEGDGEEGEAAPAAPAVVKLQDDAEEPQSAAEALPSDESGAVQVGVEDVEDGVEKGATATVEGSPSEDERPVSEDNAETAADGEPQVSEAKTSPAIVEVHAEETPGHEDEEVDSLLEVFREVQFSDNPISLLSRDLGDTDVYSLLEEMRWIAKKVKEASTESS